MKTEAQKFFEQQQNTSVDDLSFPQCDEQELTYGEIQQLRKERGEDYEVSEPPSARYVAMDDAIVKSYESINRPSHYNLCGSDTMAAIEKILGTEAYLGFLCGNVWKYRIRCGKKDGSNIEQDIKKALYYEKLYDDFVRENTPPKD